MVHIARACAVDPKNLYGVIIYYSLLFRNTPPVYFLRILPSILGSLRCIDPPANGNHGDSAHTRAKKGLGTRLSLDMSAIVMLEIGAGRVSCMPLVCLTSSEVYIATHNDRVLNHSCGST